MKKEYMIPAIEELLAETTDMIATSLNLDNDEVITNPDDILSREFTFDVN